MEQPTFADLEYGRKKRRTRREEFLEKLERLVPWQRLEERIKPHYFRGERGRRPYALAVMLRVHIVQLCYNLSDPAMEDLLYEAESARRFAGLRLTEALPDESTILHFRHLLERHQLGQGLFAEIRDHLEEQGVRLREGTIVDATIIEAPSSTKNRTGERDPGDAAGEEGEPIPLRHEAAHRGGRQDRGGAQPERHPGQRTRRDPGPPVAAWRRAAGVGRRGLHRGAEAPGEPGAGSGLAGGDEAGARGGSWNRTVRRLWRKRTRRRYGPR